MTEKEKGVAGSKAGNRPSPKTLKTFVDRRGYFLLESMGEGATAQQRQIGGWEKQGVISWLKARTGISRTTLYKIKAWFPTLESTGTPRGVWIKQENYERLKDILLQLKDIEKRFTKVQQYFQSSLIVDLAMLRARRELRGESLEVALKAQIEMDENRESDMEKVFNEALRELSQASWFFAQSLHS